MSRYDGKLFTNFTTAQGLANNKVRSIIEDNNGNIWFATDGGVSRYDGRHLSSGGVNEKVGSFTNYTIAQGLAGNNISSIAEDRNGNIWIGTNNGLCVIKGIKAGDEMDKAPLPFTSYSTADGLPNNSVTKVVELPSGKIAVGTNLGIAVFDAPISNTHFGQLKNIEIYNNNTGYPIKDVNEIKNSMFIANKGIIWVGTGSDKTALVRFDPTAVNRNHEPPKVVLQSIKVLGEQVCWYNLESEDRRRKTEVRRWKWKYRKKSAKISEICEQL